jgi:hypothetical protein
MTPLPRTHTHTHTHTHTRTHTHTYIYMYTYIIPRVSDVTTCVNHARRWLDKKIYYFFSFIISYCDVVPHSTPQHPTTQNIHSTGDRLTVPHKPLHLCVCVCVCVYRTFTRHGRLDDDCVTAIIRTYTAYILYQSRWFIPPCRVRYSSWVDDDVKRQKEKPTRGRNKIQHRRRLKRHCAQTWEKTSHVIDSISPPDGRLR